MKQSQLQPQFSVRNDDKVYRQYQRRHDHEPDQVVVGLAIQQHHQQLQALLPQSPLMLQQPELVEGQASRRPLIIKKMVSPISFLWCLLSILCAGVSFFCFLQPFWIVEPRRPHCLGIFSFCVNANDLPHLRRSAADSHGGAGKGGGTVCGLYAGRFAFSNLPSDAWRATCVLFGGGCLLQSLCALAAMGTLCLRDKLDRMAARAAGFVQGVAVLLCIGGLLTYPVGFGSSVVQHFCSHSGRQAGIFRTGSCELGWSYLLAAMVTSLALFCPILASLYDIHVCLQLADSPSPRHSGYYPDTERSAERISDRSFASRQSGSDRYPGGGGSLASQSNATSGGNNGNHGNHHASNNWSSGCDSTIHSHSFSCPTNSQSSGLHQHAHHYHSRSHQSGHLAGHLAGCAHV